MVVKYIVPAFVKALNEDDLKTARTYVWYYMDFKGVITTREGAANYFEVLAKMNFKYAIK